MSNSQRQQIDIGDLVVAKNAGKVDGRIVADRNIVGPKLVVEFAGRAFELTTNLFDTGSAKFAVVG